MNLSLLDPRGKVRRPAIGMRGRRLAFESLEARRLLAAFSVNSFLDAVDADPGDGAALTSDGVTTLRAAVMEANALEGDDSISLPSGRYEFTLPGWEDSAAAGDLSVTDGLTVLGADAETTIVDAAGLDRIFRVTSDVRLDLSGLQLTNGFAHSGGAITNSGTLTMTDCILQGNRADTNGGAVYNAGVSTLTRTTFESNLAQSGGAIHSFFSTVTLEDCTLEGNSATLSGGAVSGNGELTMTDTTLRDSSASTGGAISFSDTTILSGCLLEGNSALSVGGAIHSSNGTVTLTDCTLDGNSAASGAGIHYVGKLTLVRTTVSNNVADSFSSGNGGGVYVFGMGSVATVSNSAISGNSASSAGGGIYGSGTLTLSNTSLSDNSAGFRGGGIFNTGTLDLNDCTLTTNSSGGDGGALYNAETATLVDTTVEGNSTLDNGNGGGIGNEGTLTLTDCTLSHNTTVIRELGPGYYAFGFGGAVYNGFDTATLSGCTLFANEAASGGGIFNQYTASLTNSTLSGNSSVVSGGAIRNHGHATLALTNVTVTDNSSDLAGGVDNYQLATVHSHNTIIAANSAAASPDVNGTFLSEGGNLIGNDEGSSGWQPISDILNVPAQLGPLQDNGGPTWTHAPLVFEWASSPAVDAGDPAFDPYLYDPPLLTDQRGAARVHDGDGDGVARVDIGAHEYGAQRPTVVARRIFYNHSTWDDPAAGRSDEDAIAPGKVALRPNQTATFANYTGYDKGINGIIVDVAGLPGTPTADDFEFKIGNDDDPGNWEPLTAPPEIAVRPGEGTNNSDRVTLTWPDNTIRNTWLQIAVLATANTSLAQPDIFYFGNAIGETGNSMMEARGNAVDVLLARNNPRTLTNPASIDFPHDFNRDQRVNATDMLIARNNQTHLLNALKLIAVPGDEGKSAVRLDIGGDVAVDTAFAGKVDGARCCFYELEEMATDRRAFDKVVRDTLDVLLVEV